MKCDYKECNFNAVGTFYTKHGWKSLCVQHYRTQTIFHKIDHNESLLEYIEEKINGKA